MSIAKLWVNHISMTGNLADHISYLTNGHQMDADEPVRLFTKSIPKACKNDRTALVQHWQGIYDKFTSERARPESQIHHNAKVSGRQFVINLPNDISDKQINQLAKAVLKDFPRHLPVSMVLHTSSNRGKTHFHLQGLFSYRNGGYGSINDQFRLNITKQMKATVAAQFKKLGYTVDYGTPGTINNKLRQWLCCESTVEQRRNPFFMRDLAKKASNERLKKYCLQQAAKMEARIPKPASTIINQVDQTHLLLTTGNQEVTGTQDPQDQVRTEIDRPLTEEMLVKEHAKLMQWKHTKTITKNI